MFRRGMNGLALLLIAAVALTVCELHGGDSATPPRPNIVLIVADDLGFSDLGCYGGEIRTPNLDRLAAQGMQFTQFYNCGVCVATRAALYTGLHPRASGQRLREEMTTLGEVMQSAGYQTALVGKWHLGHRAPNRPIDRGFQECYGLLDGCCNYFDPSQPDPEFYNGGKSRHFADQDQPVKQFPSDYYTTDAFAERAAEIVGRFATSDKPFFLNVCFTAPHFPLQAREEDIARYQGKYNAGYLTLREKRFARQQDLKLLDPRWKLAPVDRKTGSFRYDYDIPAWSEADSPRERRRMEVYAAMVDALDVGVGRILRALDEAGKADNTLVLFFSDNGGCGTLPSDREGWVAYNRDKLPGGSNTYEFCGPGWSLAQNTPFRRWKTWMYEGGIATPLVARWPAVIKAGSRSDELSHVVDLLPTFVELAGGAYPSTRAGKAVPPSEGLSLAATLRGESRDGHKTLCWYLYDNRAIREGKWKLVWGASDRRWELYDMEADRTETTDLAAQHPDRVERLRQAWHAWAQQVGVPVADRSAL